MPPAPLADRIVLYVRAGCTLCEEAAETLDAVLGADGYRTVDIETDDDLLARYAHRIPVLAVDGVDRVEAPITPGEVGAALGPSPAASHD